MAVHLDQGKREELIELLDSSDPALVRQVVRLNFANLPSYEILHGNIQNDRHKIQWKELGYDGPEAVSLKKHRYCCWLWWKKPTPFPASHTLHCRGCGLDFYHLWVFLRCTIPARPLEMPAVLGYLIHCPGIAQALLSASLEGFKRLPIEELVDFIVNRRVGHQVRIYLDWHQAISKRIYNERFANGRREVEDEDFRAWSRLSSQVKPHNMLVYHAIIIGLRLKRTRQPLAIGYAYRLATVLVPLQTMFVRYRAASFFRRLPLVSNHIQRMQSFDCLPWHFRMADLVEDRVYRDTSYTQWSVNSRPWGDFAHARGLKAWCLDRVQAAADTIPIYPEAPNIFNHMSMVLRAQRDEVSAAILDMAVMRLDRGAPASAHKGEEEIIDRFLQRGTHRIRLPFLYFLEIPS